MRGALEEWLDVSPGDIVVGDSDGQIVVPHQMLAEVTSKVVEWSRLESGARAEIIAGLPCSRRWRSTDIYRCGLLCVP